MVCDALTDTVELDDVEEVDWVTLVVTLDVDIVGGLTDVVVI